MSRSRSRAFVALLLAALLTGMPAAAQVAGAAPVPAAGPAGPAPGATSAEQALSTAQAAYGPKVTPRTCPDAPATGEIVVCARKQDDAEFRVQSTRELHPDSHQATYDGLPRAPNVHGIPTCKETGNPCIGLGKVPPPIYYIDLTKIPEAPAGSDADKIAKGVERQP